jgi:hypothetical protein
MNNSSVNIIKRQLMIIQFLLESNYVSTEDIQKYLKANSFDVPIRNIQRDLAVLEEIVMFAVTRLDLFCKSCIVITVPEPPTPANVRTAASFIVITAVGDSPNSVLTSDSDICPEGVAII